MGGSEIAQSGSQNGRKAVLDAGAAGGAQHRAPWMARVKSPPPAGASILNLLHQKLGIRSSLTEAAALFDLDVTESLPARV